MCGICGKVVFSQTTVDPALIDKMCGTLTHRGPDDQGIYTAPHVGLGQRRLSVIDLRRAATAPLSNEDETVWVVYNGEIYNFRELRSSLMAKGHVFQTACDTEVLPHLYEEYGVECLTRIEGMFALALWDGRKKRLFAARDRLGQKPFCYALNGRSFVFGSEIKAITADPEVSVAPCYPAIDLYLTYQYVPSPLTAFEGVSRLPPGHFLTCTLDGNVQVCRYWSPPLVPKTSASRADVEAELRHRLRRSVRSRLLSDVPVGAFLSGGIDSATIVAMMATESSEPVRTFSIGFEKKDFNEIPYARLIARRYGTLHHELVVRPVLTTVLPLLVRHYNEPFADSSALPTYYVSQMARRHVTVALSGDGGDESCAGYRRYVWMLRLMTVDLLPLTLRKAMFAPCAALLRKMPYRNVSAMALWLANMLHWQLPRRYHSFVSSLRPEDKDGCYTRRMWGLLRRQPAGPDRPATVDWDRPIDARDWMMHHDQSFYLPDCLMVKTDIAMI